MEINNLTGKPYEKVNKPCLRCGNGIYKSDVKDYPYVCLNCDENMFSFEVEG